MLEKSHGPEARPTATRASEENGNPPLLKILGYLVKRHFSTGPGGVLDLQSVTQKLVVLLQGSYHQVIEREPHGAAPGGVPAEHGSGGLGRFVVDRGAQLAGLELVGSTTQYRLSSKTPVSTGSYSGWCRSSDCSHAQDPRTGTAPGG